MCFKSIYKRLKKDFEFLNEYGYKYECDGKHNVQPYVMFRKTKFSLLIGYAYDEKRFFISFFNDSIKAYPSEWNLNAIALFKNGWEKPEYVIGEDTVLPGNSYNDQLDAAIKILKDFLDKSQE